MNFFLIIGWLLIVFIGCVSAFYALATFRLSAAFGGSSFAAVFVIIAVGMFYLACAYAPFSINFVGVMP